MSTRQRKKRVVLLAGIVLSIVIILGINLGKEEIICLAGTGIVGASVVKDVDPDVLSIVDFPDIPGVTQEYVDAYKLFLKAKTGGDKTGHTYQQAGDAFNKIARTTENPELKLRSLYMITLCHFLQSEIDKAYQSGMQIMEMNKELSRDNVDLSKRLSFLKKVIMSAQAGEIRDVKTLREVINTHGKEAIEDIKETGVLIEDFSLFQDRVKKLKEFKRPVNYGGSLKW